MGMTIDDCINYFESTIDELAKEGQYCDVFEMVLDTMRKYQQLQADYETRLKADMEAALTELQLEIEELPYYRGTYVDNIDRKKVIHKIQQKINALKGGRMKDTDGKRYCDRCGVLLTEDNNKCGYELCDKCNDWLEQKIQLEQKTK